MTRPAGQTPMTPNRKDTLAERFWRIAKGMDGTGIDGDSVDPVAIVKHVLSILDALDRGERGAPVSVHTLSFLKMLREAENTGDLSYAAPEQICGEMLDERSLVFSVGVLLFERLTGRHPFGAEGKPQRRVARIRRGEFGSGVNYFPTVPSGLRSILMRAMGPFPEERWSSLRELRSHLEQFIAREDKEVYLPGASAPTRARTSRLPKFANDRTKLHDMGPQVRAELIAAAGMKTVSGEVEASPPPRPLPKPDVSVETEAEIARALMPNRLESEYIPNLKPRAPGSLKPLLYVGLGAAIASIAFMVWSGRSDHDGAAASAAATPASDTATPADEGASASAATPSATDDEKAEPKAATEPKARPAPKAPVPKTFEPEYAMNKTLATIRPCLTPQQIETGVAFGLGARFAKTGEIKRLYFAGNDELPWKTRRCMNETIKGKSIGVGPSSSRIIDGYIRVHGTETRIKIKE